MNCPNCNEPRMLTTETFSLPDGTIRTKKCRSCAWTYKSREELCDDLSIPDVVRKLKRGAAPCASTTS